MRSRGKVYLVGAGPGDPGLITVKGLRLLEKADVVVYDRLVDPRLVERAPPGAEVIDVGKGRGQHRLTQGEINTLLVEQARQGWTVVRLKGGDPFVFGRGGEEAEALAQAGIPFEVVPGVTSAVAAPAYAGIPLTHRQIASSFIVVSGSEDPAKEETLVDWEHLASSGSTLVVLMGWEALPRIMETLLAHGRSPDTPVALIRWGTEPFQQTVVGSLGDIVSQAQGADLAPPVVAVVGPVVNLRPQLSWFDTKPLFGKRVLVTRSRQQASVLSDLLRGEGAQVVELPTIAVEPVPANAALTDTLHRLGEYNWVVFTSSNGVDVFFRHLEALGKDSRALGGVKVCAIGPATAEALRGHGLRADLVPAQYVAEALVKALHQEGVTGRRVLLARADIGRGELRWGLEEAGARVDQVTLYRTVLPPASRELAQGALAEGIDVVTFASSSTVRNLAALLGGDLSPLGKAVVACIGPVTAATARELGLVVQVEAQEHTIPGLVQTLVAYFSPPGGG